MNITPSDFGSFLGYFLGLLALVATSYTSVIICRRKGQSPLLGASLGFFLSILGVGIALLLPMTSRPVSRPTPPAKVALTALLVALTTIFTLIIRVPIPATQGYINLSAVAIAFSAINFGPGTGMIAGGVGAALADLIGGYPQFALLSLIAHGLEGMVIGWLSRGRRSWLSMILAWFCGAVMMVTCYLIGEGLFLTGWPAAFAEIPANMIQSLAGAIVGVPLAKAVRESYPPVMQIGQQRKWTK